MLTHPQRNLCSFRLFLHTPNVCTGCSVHVFRENGFLSFPFHFQFDDAMSIDAYCLRFDCGRQPEHIGSASLLLLPYGEPIPMLSPLSFLRGRLTYMIPATKQGPLPDSTEGLISSRRRISRRRLLCSVIRSFHLVTSQTYSTSKICTRIFTYDQDVLGVFRNLLKSSILRLPSGSLSGRRISSSLSMKDARLRRC